MNNWTYFNETPDIDWNLAALPSLTHCFFGCTSKGHRILFISPTSIFKSKTLLLRSPGSLLTTIFHARFLSLFHDYNGRVLLEDNHGLGEMLQAAAPCIEAVAPEFIGNEFFEIEYELDKLYTICRAKSPDIPCLIPDPCRSRQFGALIDPKFALNIGLVFRNPEMSGIFGYLPRHRLTHSCFYAFARELPPADDFIAFGVNCMDVTGTVRYLSDVAALTYNMDCVITDDEASAHLAGAMGRKVLFVRWSDEPVQDMDPGCYPSMVTITHNTSDLLEDTFLRASLAFLFGLVPYSRLLSQDVAFLERNISAYRSCFPDIADPADMLPLLYAETPEIAHISIETTTVCNLRCSYCPNSSIGRPENFMADAVFYRIIDSVANYNPAFRGAIVPHFYGEPLLDPRLETFIRYVRMKLPSAEVHLFTNGLLLSAERFQALAEAGMSKIVISQHSAKPSAQIAAVMHSITRSNPCGVKIEYFDQFHSLEKLNRGGMVKGVARKRMTRCNLFQEMVFDFAGNAVLCCNDYLSEHSFGNIMQQSIGEIWNGTAYRKARNSLIYSFFLLDICRKCALIDTSGTQREPDII
jgi:8-amino-3,8-dideoxy-alpha-D-manno-octulosonate transaminase